MKNDLRAAIALALQDTSSQQPRTVGSLLDDVIERRPQTTIDDLETAIDEMTGKGEIKFLRVNNAGQWADVYWALPGTAELIAAATEPKYSVLNRLILLHGPIAGAALAQKARDNGVDIPAKNVPALLDTLIRKGQVITRKYMSATLYMTPNQAADWDDQPGVDQALPPNESTDEIKPENMDQQHTQFEMQAEIAQLKHKIMIC